MARESAMRQTAMQCAISRDRVEAPTRRQRLYCILQNRIERPHQEDATSKKHRGCYAIRKRSRRTRLRRNSVRPRRSCDGQEYGLVIRDKQCQPRNTTRLRLSGARTRKSGRTPSTSVPPIFFELVMQLTQPIQHLGLDLNAKCMFWAVSCCIVYALYHILIQVASTA